MVRTLRLLAAVALASTTIGAPASASADPADRADARLSAGTTHEVVTVAFEYVPRRNVIAAGDSLTHSNFDVEPHDLVSLDFGPDGTPWFQSELIDAGQSAPVPVEDVPPGIYSYTCSIHPFMSGTMDIRDPLAPQPPPPVAEPMAEAQVEVGDDFFEPRDVTVPAGTTILWENEGNTAHSVTAADGSWDSSPACPSARCMEPGETFTHTFNGPGTFSYYCKLHGLPGSGHAGTIRVVEPGSIPTSVDTLGVTVDGTEVAADGTATFAGETPVTLAEDAEGDGPVHPDLARETGVDLTGAAAYQPDPDSPHLFVEWRVADLPSTGSLPEAVRYTLPLRIGEERFQLQAKLTGVADTTVADDPSGQATHAGRAFQLRGDCQDAPFPSCPHLAWLNGTFDTLNGVVRVKVPLGVTPAFVPGAVLEPNEAGPAELVRIRAAYETVASVDQAADEADWMDGAAYTIPEPEVELGIAPAGTPQSEVELDAAETLEADGSFSGSLSAPGPGDWDVWARACFGDNCGFTIRRIEI